MRRCRSVLAKEEAVELPTVVYSLVHSWHLTVGKWTNSDPGLYLMYSPVLEIFPYLGGLPGLLDLVETESDRCGWFGCAVACMTMAVDGVGLNETFAANSPIFVVGE